ncbi:MAG TPA: type IX secretion system outer membrane channel protein PorV [Chitinophagales bacterium]|nr:type IX secretion system outer membrane channel protein PorV [Chitinophagales bacterium]
MSGNFSYPTFTALKSQSPEKENSFRLQKFSRGRQQFLLSLLFSLSLSYGAFSQTTNVISTAVPFLCIAPDARAAGMGDAGLALSADANAIFWNTAKISLSQKQFDLGFSYTPWLHSMVEDLYLATVGGFARIDDHQGIAFGLRYFNLGDIFFTSASGSALGEFKPREYCFDAGYSRKLTKYFSTGINLGFVHSNLASGYSINNIPIKAGKAVKADLSFFYHHPMKFSPKGVLRTGKKKSDYNIGATISNIGNKITYTQNAQNKDFLPANLGLAGGITLRFDDYNRLTFDLDFNKLLVPTPDDSFDYRHESVPQGIFSSFTDAPGGFNEELREVTISSGAEYSYHDIFYLRGGFFLEDKTKGSRQYLTAGFGIAYQVFDLNFSYLIPTSRQLNPLDNTLRFSLNFYFDRKEKQEPTSDGMIE